MDDDERTNERKLRIFFDFWRRATHRRQKSKKMLRNVVLRIFFDFWRRATHRHQKSKKMLNENLAFVLIFGGVLRTATKNRKKYLKKSVSEFFPSAG